MLRKWGQKVKEQGHTLLVKCAAAASVGLHVDRTAVVSVCGLAIYVH